MTASAYSKRLKRAETRGHRKVRVIVPRDVDGNILGLFLPEEMKKIRKVSKLPAKAVQSNQQEEFRKTMTAGNWKGPLESQILEAR